MSPKSPEKYLSTGIAELDEILATQAARPGGGIPIERSGHRLAPIVLVNGETGTGKTTLMLQMAFSAARRGWMPLFCPLEQTVQSLMDMATSFGDFKAEASAAGVTFVEAWDPVDDLANAVSDKSLCPIRMVHLAPRPVSEGSSHSLVQTRLDQLDHILRQLPGLDAKPIHPPVFFIDSMDAFSPEILTRNETYRLFALFRNAGVPAILTMERHFDYQLGTDSDSVQNAKFLADVVMTLSKDWPSGYLNYFLEVEKSRVSRQASGRHVYKIRTESMREKTPYDSRTGIVPYPSANHVLSRPRETLPDSSYVMCRQDTIGKEKDTYLIVRSTTVQAGQCFSIVGPPGTHKLALGMNLSTGYVEGEHPRLLVVNFGGSGHFKFDGVAWFEERAECRRLRPLKLPQDLPLGSPPRFQNPPKFQKADYHAGSYSRGGPRVTTITFRIGELTPEECFYVVDKAIAEGPAGGGSFSSVLLSDTAELCNGFPLLGSDPLFLPALIELFAARKLVTVCIGVDEGASAKNTGINYSLESRADCRIVLSHYPSISELQRRIVDPQGAEGDHPQNQQIASLVVDNVTGKHYERRLRWLWVKEEGARKTLNCGTDWRKALEGAG